MRGLFRRPSSLLYSLCQIYKASSSFLIALYCLIDEVLHILFTSGDISHLFIPSFLLVTISDLAAGAEELTLFFVAQFELMLWHDSDWTSLHCVTKIENYFSNFKSWKLTKEANVFPILYFRTIDDKYLTLMKSFYCMMMMIQFLLLEHYF